MKRAHFSTTRVSIPGMTIALSLLSPALPLLAASAARADGPPAIVQVFGGQRGTTSLAYSPDGQTIASGAFDATIKLWDTADGRLKRTLMTPVQPASLAYSPDGSALLSGHWDGVIRIWSPTDGALVRELPGHFSGVLGLALTPDGQTLVSSGADRTVRVWDWPNGSPLRTLTGHMDYVYGLASSPDGVHVASGSNDKTIRIWRISDGALIRTLNGHTSYVTGVAYSPDGSRLYSCSLDRSLRTWQISNGQLLRNTSLGTCSATALGVCDGGAAVAVTACHDVQIYQTSDGALLRTLPHADFVRTLAVSAAGDRLATVCKTVASGTIHEWNLNSGDLIHSFVGHSDHVPAVAFDPTADTVWTGSHDQTVRSWDVGSGQQLSAIDEEWGVNSLSVAPDGTRVAVADFLSRIVLRDPSDGQIQATISGFGEVYDVEYSASGALLAAGMASGHVRVFDPSGGALLQTFGPLDGPVFDVEFSPDDALLAAGASCGCGELPSDFGPVAVWRLSDGVEIFRRDAHVDATTSVAFSPDGALLASVGEDDALRLWRVATGEPVRTAHAGAAQAGVLFTADGRSLLTTCADGTIRVWRTADLGLRTTYDQETAGAWALARSADGALFAYSRDDASVVVAQTPTFCDAVDTNCDGSFNGFDVDPFVELLTGGAGPCAPCAGDVNGDGSVDGGDIDGFVDALLGAG